MNQTMSWRCDHTSRVISRVLEMIFFSWNFCIHSSLMHSLRLSISCLASKRSCKLKHFWRPFKTHIYIFWGVREAMTRSKSFNKHCQISFSLNLLNENYSSASSTRSQNSFAGFSSPSSFFMIPKRELSVGNPREGEIRMLEMLLDECLLSSCSRQKWINIDTIFHPMWIIIIILRMFLSLFDLLLTLNEKRLFVPFL